MWLHDFELDVIWTEFQGFLKQHSHISVLWRLSRIFVISEFSYRTQNENLEIIENLYFLVYNAQMHVDLFFWPQF